jgi:hypothetical protein
VQQWARIFSEIHTAVDKLNDFIWPVAELMRRGCSDDGRSGLNSGLTYRLRTEVKLLNYIFGET